MNNVGQKSSSPSAILVNRRRSVGAMEMKMSIFLGSGAIAFCLVDMCLSMVLLFGFDKFNRFSREQ